MESAGSMLGAHNLKVQFWMCPSEGTTVARQCLKHFLLYSFL